MSTAGLFTGTRYKHQMSINWWTDQWNVHPQAGLLFNHKKEWEEVKKREQQPGSIHLCRPGGRELPCQNLVTVLEGLSARGRGPRPLWRRTRSPVTENTEPHMPHPSRLGCPGKGARYTSWEALGAQSQPPLCPIQFPAHRTVTQ